MPDQSVVYFPLRSNAASLVAGQGVAAVRRRLMVASLLHDHVLLEGGVWRANQGSQGGFSHWQGSEPGGQMPRWQAARTRSSAQHGNLTFQVRASDAPADAPFHALVHGPSTIAWEATFEPFRLELPLEAAEWMSFGHGADAPDPDRVATRWAWSASSDAQIQALWPDQFIRDLYVKGTHQDLLMAAALGAAVSVDHSHGPVVAERMRVGEATPVMGHRALHLYLPTGFGWGDVADLRRHKALTEYRAVMRDVEAAARDTAVTLADLDAAIREEYSVRVARAEGRRPSGWARVAVGLVAFVAGELVGQRASLGPGVGGSAAVAAHYAADEVAERRARPRWLSVNARLRPPTGGR